MPVGERQVFIFISFLLFLVCWDNPEAKNIPVTRHGTQKSAYNGPINMNKIERRIM